MNKPFKCPSSHVTRALNCDGSPRSSFGIRAPEHSIHSGAQSRVSSQTHFQPLYTLSALLLQWFLSSQLMRPCECLQLAPYGAEEPPYWAQPTHRLMRNKAWFIVYDTAKEKWDSMYLVLSRQWVPNTGQDVVISLQRKGDGRMRARPMGLKDGWPMRRENKMTDLRPILTLLVWRKMC